MLAVGPWLGGSSLLLTSGDICGVDGSDVLGLDTTASWGAVVVSPVGCGGLIGVRAGCVAIPGVGEASVRTVGGDGSLGAVGVSCTCVIWASSMSMSSTCSRLLGLVL